MKKTIYLNVLPEFRAKLKVLAAKEGKTMLQKQRELCEELDIKINRTGKKDDFWHKKIF